MTTSRPSRPSGRLRRPVAVLAFAAALVVLTVSGGIATGLIGPTSSGYASAEQIAMTVSAGTVAPPGTTCVSSSGTPHQLTLTTPSDGLAATGYLVTITVQPLPGEAWQTGTDLLPIGESTWSATQTGIRWGIDLPPFANAAYSGSVQVTTLGPGGWVSEVVTYDWTITRSLLGLVNGATCAPAVA